ncbi:MAG: M15 family metallopeptidase [Clostridia bacterium]|nr:M15 family metallopeptidase [Clostridia bacterium]
MRRFLAALLIVAALLPAAAQAGLYDSTMILVNKQNALPKSYEPDDLSYVDIAYAEGVPATRKQLREEAARALERLYAAMLEEGIEIVGVSGYRSYSTQSLIYNQRLEETSLDYVSRYVAKPGQSEHQTGLAMDVAIPDWPFLTTDFALTDAYAWLTAHAHEYGFIIRYPETGEEETGYAFEPWHIRYVGDTAAELRESGMTLEAWYRRRLGGSHARREARFLLPTGSK